MAELDSGLGTERRPDAVVLGYKPLVLREENVNHLWLGLAHLPAALSDAFGGDHARFMQTLLDPSNIFFEVGSGDGVVCCFDVVPKLKANVYPVMFDRKLKGREEMFKKLCLNLFSLLALERLGAVVSKDQETTIKFLLRCGFELEGLVRRAVRRTEGVVDQCILGVLREEIVV